MSYGPEANAGAIACGNCYFGVRGKLSDPKCHRYPPVVVPNGQINEVIAVWPQMRANDWCGEWQLNTGER